MNYHSEKWANDLEAFFGNTWTQNWRLKKRVSQKKSECYEEERFENLHVFVFQQSSFFALNMWNTTRSTRTQFTVPNFAHENVEMRKTNIIHTMLCFGSTKAYWNVEQQWSLNLRNFFTKMSILTEFLCMMQVSRFCIKSNFLLDFICGVVLFSLHLVE